jgi:serine/threonine-protein kinase CHEK2
VDLDSVTNELELYKKSINKNIVELYGYCTDDEYFYLVFELIEGGDLKSCLSKKCLSDLQKLNIILDISSGMEYLHSLNILHRGLILFLKFRFEK